VSGTDMTRLKNLLAKLSIGRSVDILLSRPLSPTCEAKIVQVMFATRRRR